MPPRGRRGSWRMRLAHSGPTLAGRSARRIRRARCRRPRAGSLEALQLNVPAAIALVPNAPALPFWFKWVFRSSGPPVDVDVVIDGDGDGDDWSNYPEEQPIRG